MSVEQMREELKRNSRYRSPGWSIKVDRMSDRQIMAVYFSFKSRTIFEKKPKKQIVEQLSLF